MPLSRAPRVVRLTVLALILLLLLCVAWSRSGGPAGGWAARVQEAVLRGGPGTGQAALSVAGADIASSGGTAPAPIASMAKVMTAYVVLQEHPLEAGRSGFTLVVTDAQVADTQRRLGRGESVVPVRAGERLNERQALLAILLPSANNVATALAEAVGGSQERFVERMNRQARSLGMRDTTYTDPSGFAADTVSTARDQVVLARAAMRLPAFAALVATRSAVLPVVGRVHNSDALLGRDGFVGIKTGSHRAAGGCFMFQSVRRVRGHDVVVLGVVMGRRGPSLALAGQRAAQQLVQHVVALLAASAQPEAAASRALADVITT